MKSVENCTPLTVGNKFGRELSDQLRYLIPLTLWTAPLYLGLQAGARLLRCHFGEWDRLDQNTARGSLLLTGVSGDLVRETQLPVTTFEIKPCFPSGSKCVDRKKCNEKHLSFRRFWFTVYTAMENGVKKLKESYGAMALRQGHRAAKSWYNNLVLAMSFLSAAWQWASFKLFVNNIHLKPHE